MKISIAVSGSHGDVRPMVALGREFFSRGHQVRLIASPGNAEFITENGIEACTCGKDWKTLLVSGMGKSVNVFSMISRLGDFLSKDVTAQFESLKEQIGKPDLVVGAGLQFAARSVAESAKIPYRHILHMPQAVKSRYHPPLSAMFFNLPHWMNQLWWRGHCATFNRFVKKEINDGRKGLDLEPIMDVWAYLTDHLIVASDKSLAQLPSDADPGSLQTGYPFLFENKELDSELIEFLQGAKPVIYIGFGGAPVFASTDITGLIRSIVRELGVKVIVSKGWSNFSVNGNVPDLFEVDNVPHFELFPHLSGVVHHGGAGTTHTAALCGVPQLVIGFAFDQYYWGNRVHKLNSGPEPLSFLTAKPSHIVRRVGEMVNNPIYKKCAHDLAQSMDKHSGTGSTCDQLEKFMKARS